VDNVSELFDQHGAFDYVFHLAAVTFVPEAMRDPSQVERVNVAGTKHLLTHAAAANESVRFMNVGSSDAYGVPQFTPITEEHPFEPINPYGTSKAAADEYCGSIYQSDGVDVVRLRPFNHSGPGQSDRFVLSSFARQIAEIESGKREPMLRVGDLSPKRDFLHVSDVIRAYVLAADKGNSGAAYNICSGKARRIQDALDVMSEHSRTPFEVTVDPERLRPVDVPTIEGSHARLTTDTGWTPEISFETLITDLLDYWRSAI
jgi:GDP-4-dehydro-6-deoxy-D-mannose reductase